MSKLKINGELDINSYLTAISDLYLSSADGASIIFRNGTAEAGRITSNGYLQLGGTSTGAYRLYVNGSSYFTGTNYLYGTTYGRYLYPSTDGSYSLGSSSSVWGSAYIRNLYIYDSTNNKSVGSFYALTLGTTSAYGISRLTIGNSYGSGTAGNAYGVLRIYSTSSTYGDLRSSGGSVTHYLPSTGGTLLNTGNYNSYVPKLDGTGATGTWAIDISGNATSASSVPWSGITSKPSTFTPSAHSHNTLTFGSEGSTASVRTADYTSTVLTGGWASASAGYLTQYGTTLDISGYSTWYHRLAFNTNGTIEYWQGINTKTMSKIGNLITSANIGSQSVNYANSAGSATYTSYIKDSYNGSNITITYGKAGQSSTSWLASWNGYELGAIQPSSITAGWASGASYSNSSNALASTGWGNGNFTYLQTNGDFYGNSGWSHYLISNHGDGSSYYNFVIALPFWSYPKYKRMSGGSEGSWYNFYTTENVIIQSSTPGAGFYGQIWFKI